MKKVIVFLAILAMIALPVVMAEEAEDFSAAKALIDSKVSCSSLNESQLEEIGDYYMEQMHPGPAHEAMDQMMGGEGSESLKAMHISMAERFYCGDYNYSGSNYGYGMMGGGMMGYYYNNTGYNNYNRGAGMMNGFYGGYGMMGGGWLGGLLWLLYIAIGAFVFGVVFWWTQRLFGQKKK